MIGTAHGIVFSRSIRRVPKEDSGDGMLFNSITGAPWELELGVGCPACNPRETSSSRRQSGNSCQDEFTSGDQWNWRGTRTQTDVSGVSMRDWD